MVDRDQMVLEKTVASTRKEGDITIIELRNKLDVETTPPFYKYIKNLLGNGQTRLLFDLESLDYIASAGIGVFVSCRQIAQSQGGDLVISSMRENTKQIFDLLGFSKIFPIFSNRQEGIDFLKT